MRGRAWTLGFLAASGAYLAMALTFPLGTVARPGPGFFPVGVGVFLCLAAAALAMAGFRSAAAPVPRLAPDERARVVATVAGLAGFCLLMPWLGYPACAFLFVALLLRRLGGSAWPVAVIIAALSALLTHYVFGILLGVPLPRGPF